MNKAIVSFCFFSVFGLMAMELIVKPDIEKKQFQTFDFTIGNTNIRISTQSIFKVDGNADVIVDGFMKQLSLIEHNPKRYFPVADLRIDRDNTFSKREMQSKMVFVVEPEIPNKVSKYEWEIEIDEYRASFDYVEKRDVDIQLIECYQRILSDISSIKEFPHKTIAISEIGTHLGLTEEQAALIAVKTITNFVKNNPETYALIHLLVEKSDTVDVYKRLIETSL
jgi:hypothetical protein